MAKTDLRRPTDKSWNQLAGKLPAAAAQQIYDDALRFSAEARDWYWTAIKGHRVWSVMSRAVSYVLVVYGVLGPLIAAAASSADKKLLWTQSGVVALALAGIFQLGDKVFGWSSGWLRYMSTVTAIEKLTLQFELSWTAYFVARTEPVGQGDLRALFDLARAFEVEVDARRGAETDAWVAEFNSGTAALGEMVKYQREATERMAEATRVAAAARIEAAAKATSPSTDS